MFIRRQLDKVNKMDLRTLEYISQTLTFDDLHEPVLDYAVDGTLLTNYSTIPILNALFHRISWVAYRLHDVTFSRTNSYIYISISSSVETMHR